MGKISKKQKQAVAAIDVNKSYPLVEAFQVAKQVSYVKFNASVDLHVRLGVDPKQANQMVRGTAALPHGTGKTVRVLVLTTPDLENAAREAGADHVGLNDYIEKIQQGWTDIDVIICSPNVMAQVGKLGRILGPRGLMPNPKSGTVTTDVGTAVKEVKAGKIDFRVDKTGIIHAAIGKVSFTPEQLSENATELLNVLSKLKPPTAKGVYFRGIVVATTMGPGIKVEKSSVAGL